ncbi:MAG: sigma-70 family RNA polymerase sigma factor [Firmicutes bacterium]|jgi:RNA polymerase sigma-70 factor (ECF subfamily)|nr:sigma-70 family RNA polymerase sigma factor [Bacillota bacterium]
MIGVRALIGGKKSAEKAIEQICLETWEPLYRYIYYRVQNRAEAEDILQETYVKALTYLQAHKIPHEELLKFMKAVAMNEMRDRWRRKKRQGLPVDFDAINPEDAGSEDQEYAVTWRLILENALQQLSVEQRAILDLRIIKGYSVAETAKLVGKTEAAVRTAQHRALQTLAQLLEQDQY